MSRHTTVIRLVVLLVLILSITVPNALSQPNWVKDAAALEIELSGTDDALAIVLHNSSNVKIKSDGSCSNRIEKAIKVLAPSGVEETYLFVSIDPLREVKDLKGWHISPDGSKQILKKEQIVITGFPSESGYYDDQRTLSAAFPDVKTGDIVAYEYNYAEKASWEGYFVSFYFQSDLPVMSSEFEITVPPGWGIRTSEQNLEPVLGSQVENTFSWLCGYLPYRPDEPFMPDWNSLTRHIMVGCYEKNEKGARGFDNWNAVASWASDIYENNSPVDESISRTIAGIIESSPTPEDKLRNLAVWVQNNIRYVAVELGVGRFEPRPATETMANKFGDCKDKATLMGAMLAQVNIPSRPVLAKVGKIVDEFFPSPGQFNHVILSIPLDEISSDLDLQQASVDGWLYFDPTDPITSLGNLPTSLHGTKVLRINRSESDLVNLPSLKPEQRHRVYNARAELLADNSIKAEVTIKDYGNRASESRLYWRSTSEQDHLDNYKRLLSESIRNLAITDFQRHQDGDSAWLTFSLTGEKYLSEMGQLRMLKPNFFRADRNNELTKETRIHPISFGLSEITNYDIEWILPEGYTLSGKLDSLQNITAQASMSCLPEFKDGILYYLSERIYYGLVYDITEYKLAQSFENDLKSANRLRIFLAKP